MLPPSTLAKRLVLLVLFALGLTACGVRLNATGTGTELFRDLDLTGEKQVGQELTVTIKLTPVYPIPVRVACYYENGDTLRSDFEEVPFEDRATLIGESVLPGRPGLRPEDKVDPVELSFPFTLTEAGQYFLTCNTPFAPDNGMGISFRVQP